MLSGSDYKAIFDGQWDRQGVTTASSWERALNSDNMNNPSGFWQYTGKEMTFSPIEGQKDAYSVNVKLNYAYKTSGKGAAEGQKNIQVSQQINTGITVRKTDVNTYQSDNLK